MNTEIHSQYQSLSGHYQTLFLSKKNKLKLISTARLICFLCIFPAFYYLYPINKPLSFFASLLCLAAFLFLVRKFIQTEKQLRFYQRLMQINQREANALKRDYSPFDSGAEFTDIHHDYSFDLDLFGTGSFFQYLNRTATSGGKKHLAELLKNSRRTADEIVEKQQAIAELAEELTWRQHFTALGQESNDPTSSDQIHSLISHQIRIKNKVAIRYLLLSLPLITVSLFAAYFSGVTDKYVFLPAIFLQWILFIIFIKRVTAFYRQSEKQSKLLGRYAAMLQLVEQKTFRSNYLNKLKGKLLSHHRQASEITGQLQKILNELEYRQNLLVGLVLESVFLWDLRCLYRMNDWQEKYAGELPKWIEVIAEFDALLSLANCNYNHPEWVLPEICHSAFNLEATDMGHPLIDENRCVRNSFHLGGKEQVVIITGANMAGKSTFLRTIGINLLLGTTGCKVCASKFKFTPVRVFTNMRTSDNLMNDESYFYAELLRLQNMLKLIRNGENLFVIIDEMLRGTNSVDKLNGSKELIRQLISLKTHGIVATHDLNLTELAQVYPEVVKNQCFEVQLQNDELTFNYRLTDGVTRTMNASFLMKKMGIIPKS